MFPVVTDPSPPLSPQFRPSKRLGQNFLVDRNIAAKIASHALAPMPGNTGGAGVKILEIGPGQGALTKELMNQGAEVTAIEVDYRLAEALPGLLPKPIEIVRADALDTDWAKFLPERGIRRIAANLPYSISTEILFGLIESAGAWDLAVLMLQSEVADRLAAKPGSKDYGSLSVAMQLQCEVKLAFRVPPTVFRPVPKVRSAVVELRTRPGAASFETARERSKIVRGAFAHRRKTIANSLELSLGLKSTEIREILKSADVDPGSRAEVHPPPVFIRLYEGWRSYRDRTATAGPESRPHTCGE